MIKLLITLILLNIVSFLVLSYLSYRHNKIEEDTPAQPKEKGIKKTGVA